MVFLAVGWLCFWVLWWWSSWSRESPASPEVSAIRDRAKEQIADCRKIDDADGFKDLKKICETQYEEAEAAYRWRKWNTVATKYSNVVAKCDLAIKMDQERNAVAQKDRAQVSDWKYVVENGEVTITSGETGKSVIPANTTGALVIPAALDGRMVTRIGDYAFYECENLKSVTILSCVTSIGHAAFKCSGLTAVTIPSSVISIGERAFTWCLNLTSVTFEGKPPKGVVEIPTRVLIRYPVKYESEWLPVLKECGFSKHEAVE